MLYKTRLLLLCALLLPGCVGTVTPNVEKAKVVSVKENKAILQTDTNFFFLDDPASGIDWRTKFTKGDVVTLIPGKKDGSYSAIILANGSRLSLN